MDFSKTNPAVQVVSSGINDFFSFPPPSPAKAGGAGSAICSVVQAARKSVLKMQCRIDFGCICAGSIEL
jgi:hypothetical protein